MGGGGGEEEGAYERGGVLERGWAYLKIFDRQRQLH